MSRPVTEVFVTVIDPSGVSAPMIPVPELNDASIADFRQRYNAARLPEEHRAHWEMQRG